MLHPLALRIIVLGCWGAVTDCGFHLLLISDSGSWSNFSHQMISYDSDCQTVCNQRHHLIYSGMLKYASTKKVQYFTLPPHSSWNPHGIRGFHAHSTEWT